MFLLGLFVNSRFVLRATTREAECRTAGRHPEPFNACGGNLGLRNSQSFETLQSQENTGIVPTGKRPESPEKHGEQHDTRRRNAHQRGIALVPERPAKPIRQPERAFRRQQRQKHRLGVAWNRRRFGFDSLIDFMVETGRGLRG